MSSPAHVQSLAALGEFRAALLTFRTEAQDALASLSMDVRRADEWLTEQRKFWERMVRECYDEVVHAKAELVRRQMVPPGDRVPDTSQQEEDLRRAQNRHHHAEEKVAACRKWAGQLQRAVEEFDGPVRRLGGRVEIELLKAASMMERLIAQLDAYLNFAPPPTRTP
ncbi:MAG: hypothetical protein ACJ8C4_12760 [Gemmataceae bacterium]